MYSNLLDSKPLIGLLIGVAISTSSCKSDPGSIFKDGHSGKPIVLVAGYSGTNGTNHVAKFWMDGQETVLSNGSNDAYANSIFVSGSNVYIAGTEATPETGSPVYWQNNTEDKTSHKIRLTVQQIPFVYPVATHISPGATAPRLFTGKMAWKQFSNKLRIRAVPPVRSLFPETMYMSPARAGIMLFTGRTGTSCH